MSRIARFTSRLVQTQSRAVHSKPANIYGHKLAGAADGPAKTTTQLSNLVYANFFRRNAVFITLIVGAAAVGSGLYDEVMEAAWEYNNKGKLFNDVIKQYPNLPPNTEPEGGDEPAAEEETEEETSSDEPADESTQQSESNHEVAEQTSASA